MNIQKAIDKAREKRESGKVRVQEKPTAPILQYLEDETPWTAPVYNTSTNITIDPDVLKANRCICIEPDSPEVECYKFLRAKIQFHAVKNDWRSVLITSPTPGDGKTLTAVNLALTVAKAYDQTVLLADCDLKRQSVHKFLSVTSIAGLQNYLVDHTPLENIIVWPGIEKLSFISGGKPIANSAEVVGSPRMKALVKELKTRYEDRIVLFDAPPVLSGADTLALAPLMDCIIMVVTEGKTSLKDIRQAIDMLPSDKLLGFVMNQQKTNAFNGYYYN